MRIGELNEHCGKCSLIGYCSEPYCEPQLCMCERLEDVEEEKYIEIADSVTEEEIEDKLNQYEENGFYPWDNERNGAICDIVLEKLLEVE